MKIKSQLQKGFTLIELMITVAIVGILAAVALPAYQDYTIRAQTSEGMLLAEGAKTAVAEKFSSTGSLTGIDATTAGFSGAVGKYVKTVTIADGVITATFSKSSPQSANSNLDNKTITLTPTESTSGNLTWSCGSTAAQKYVPSSCSGV